MTGSLLPPNSQAEISDLKKRVYDLERKLRDLALEDPPQDICTFPGPVLAIIGPTFEPTVARTYHELVLRLRVAGTTSTVFRLLLSGATFDSYTITSGVTRIQFQIYLPVAYSEYIQGQIVTAGTAAQDLTAHLRY